MVDRDRTVNWLLDMSESPAAYRDRAEDAVRLIEGLEEQVVEALAAQREAEGEAAEANDRIESLLARVNELEAQVHGLVEAFAEVKATVDGDSTQPVRDIIYGYLAERAARARELEAALQAVASSAVDTLPEHYTVTEQSIVQARAALAAVNAETESSA